MARSFVFKFLSFGLAESGLGPQCHACLHGVSVRRKYSDEKRNQCHSGIDANLKNEETDYTEHFAHSCETHVPSGSRWCLIFLVALEEVAPSVSYTPDIRHRTVVTSFFPRLESAR